MEKKSIKAIGTPLLKRLFIEQLKEAGWKPAGYSTDKNIVATTDRCIVPNNDNSSSNLYSCYPKNYYVNILYDLTTQFEEALEAFKNYHKLEEPIVCKWVITSFIHKKIPNKMERFWLCGNGMYSVSAGEYGTQTLAHMLTPDYTWAPYTVKVADTEYTVGENIVAPATHTGSKRLTITGFRINEANNNMLVLCKEFSKNGIGIENIQKAPEMYVPVVGEWATCIDGNIVLIKGAGWRKSLTFKIDKIIPHKGEHGLLSFPEKGNDVYAHALRKATPEEIKSAERLQEQDVERFAVMLTAEEIKTLKEIIKKQS